MILYDKKSRSIVILCNCGCNSGYLIRVYNKEEYKDFGTYASIECITSGNDYNFTPIRYNIIETFKNLYKIITKKPIYKNGICLNLNELKELSKYLKGEISQADKCLNIFPDLSENAICTKYSTEDYKSYIMNFQYNSRNVCLDLYNTFEEDSENIEKIKSDENIFELNLYETSKYNHSIWKTLKQFFKHLFHYKINVYDIPLDLISFKHLAIWLSQEINNQVELIENKKSSGENLDEK